MPQQIIIEGDKAQLVNMEIVHETLLENLVPHLLTEKPITLPLLSQNPVRFAFFNGDTGKGAFLVETAPRIAHMRMVHDRAEGDWPTDENRETDADGVGVWKVWIPWQYFAFAVTFRRNATGEFRDFTIEHSRLYWSKEPLHSESMDDRIFVAPTPNVDVDGRICWSQTKSNVPGLAARFDTLINSFWLTIFNEHLGHETPFDGSLTEWEDNSTSLEPHLEWDWWDNPTRNSFTIREVIEQLETGPLVNVASLDPSFAEMPNLPTNATVARFREWILGLPDGARRRLLLATQDIEIPDRPVVIEPAPEEAMP